MRTVCRDESADQKWILFDGPVDTLWIESMNTLLDDNKLLTLLSGERISMPPAVSILFEVEDLSQASPATVSRAGMIYLNVEDLGWQPFVQSWLQKKEARSERLIDNNHVLTPASQSKTCCTGTCCLTSAHYRILLNSYGTCAEYSSS